MIKLPAIWTEPVQQHNFRVLLQAMARPGKVQPLQLQLQQEQKQAAGEQALLAVLATLVDGEVALADPQTMIKSSSWPLLQAHQAEPGHADFIVCHGGQQPEVEPRLGSLSNPEQSATLILQVGSLSSGECEFALSGPGVDGKIQCAVDKLHLDWLRRRQQWVANFPMGVDWLLVSDDSVMAIPRSSQLEMC